MFERPAALRRRGVSLAADVNLGCTSGMGFVGFHGGHLRRPTLQRPRRWARVTRRVMLSGYERSGGRRAKMKQK